MDEFELLKLEIRLCVDMKVVSFKKTGRIDGVNRQHRQTASEHAFFKSDKGTVLLSSYRTNQLQL